MYRYIGPFELYNIAMPDDEVACRKHDRQRRRGIDNANSVWNEARAKKQRKKEYLRMIYRGENQKYITYT